MFVRIGGMGNEASELSTSALLEFLRGGNVTAAGEPKEEIEVFRSGFFFGATAGEEAAGETRTPWVMSTFDQDRLDGRIDPAGWEIANYLRNPVVQWAHDHRIPAIGSAADVAVREGQLVGRVIFNGREYDEFGWGIGERVRHGVIRAGSVGFLILKIEFPDKKKEPEGPALIYRKQEMLEFSVCNVPANPFALAEGVGTGGGAGQRAMRGLFRAIGKLEQEIADLKFRLFEGELLDEAKGERKEVDPFWENLFRQDGEGLN